MENHNELTHHGVKGMEWGKRRYQNTDGSFTELGKRRHAEIRARLEGKGSASTGKQAKMVSTKGENKALTELKKLRDAENKAKDEENKKTLKKKEEELAKLKELVGDNEDAAALVKKLEREIDDLKAGRRQVVRKVSLGDGRDTNAPSKSSKSTATTTKELDEYIKKHKLKKKNELTHHGIKGMKWGRRLYQNKDGTLTALGKKRYAKAEEKLKQEEKVVKQQLRTKAKIDKLDAKRKSIDELKKQLEGPTNKKQTKGDQDGNSTSSTTTKKKSVSELSDQELEAIVRRGELEARYHRAYPEKVSAGKKIWDSVIAPSLTNAAKTTLTTAGVTLGKRMVNKMLGVEDKKSDTKPKVETKTEKAERPIYNIYDRPYEEPKTKSSRSYDDPIITTWREYDSTPSRAVADIGAPNIPLLNAPSSGKKKKKKRK